MRTSVAASALALMGLATVVNLGEARADGLSVTAEDRAGCPDAAAVRREVGARLGRDPFGGTAGLSVAVEFTEERGRVVARVVIDGDDADVRRFEANRCVSVARAVILFLAVALDSRPEVDAPVSRPPPTRLEPRGQTVDNEVPGDVDVSTARQASPVWLPPMAVGAGVAGHVGLLPTAGTAVEVHASLGQGRWTVDVTGQWAPPVTRSMAGGALVASMVAVSAGPCLRESRLQACALVTGGRLSARGEGYLMSLETEVPYAAAGARVAYDLPLGARLAARMHVDANGTLTRARLAVGGVPSDEWTAPPGWLGAGVSLIARVW